MRLLVLNAEDVRRLLPMGKCIELVGEGLRALSGGEAANPLREIMWLPDRRGLLGMMPAFVGGEDEALGVKVLSIFPGNHGGDLDSHQGGVLLFDAENGVLNAVLNAGALTAVRTAAASGVATQVLARKDARVLALLGAGVQAHSHLKAMRTVREFEVVRVWNRTVARAEAFADMYEGVEVVETVRAAVDGADVVCTLTGASEPIVKAVWLSEGVHVNAVGSSTPNARELDTETVVRSRLFVDRRESTLNEAGDFLTPKLEGIIGDAHIVGELGEVLLGQVEGRSADEEMTVFKSLGVGVEDVASAAFVYREAVDTGVGTWVDL